MLSWCMDMSSVRRAPIESQDLPLVHAVIPFLAGVIAGPSGDYLRLADDRREGSITIPPGAFDPHSSQPGPGCGGFFPSCLKLPLPIARISRDWVTSTVRENVLPEPTFETAGVSLNAKRSYRAITRHTDGRIIHVWDIRAHSDAEAIRIVTQRGGDIRTDLWSENGLVRRFGEQAI